MYSFKSRIRYSEVNAQKKLDIAGIIDYFQDCSTFQSEDIGVGFEHLEARNRVWMITNWHLKIDRYPSLGEEVIISTWPTAFNSMLGYRSFTMTEPDGTLIAAAHSIWVLMDSQKLRPAKTSSIDIEKYEIEKAYPMEEVPRKLEQPTEYTKEEAFQVIRGNLDTNYHVNNGQYIKMAMEYLPTNFIIEDVVVEYKKSAVLGDMICPQITLEENKCTIVLASSENIPYCILKFCGYTSN